MSQTLLLIYFFSPFHMVATNNLLSKKVAHSLWVEVHMCVQAKGQPQVMFLRCCSSLIFLRWDLSLGSGAHPLGYPAWPEGPRHEPVSASSELELQVHITTPGVYVCF